MPDLNESKEDFLIRKSAVQEALDEKKCTECSQDGKVNHRGVCEFCEDPYGVSALMELVELEEAILRSQE